MKPPTPSYADLMELRSAADEQIKQEFYCFHDQTEIRVKVSSNGVRFYRKQCLRCGESVSKPKASSLSALERNAAGAFDEELQTRWWQRRRERYNSLSEEMEGTHNARWWAWYNAYLESPEWKAKRRAVLKRCGGICEGCLERPATQVHHKTYVRVGCEMLFDLVGICEECHKAIHPPGED